MEFDHRPWGSYFVLDDAETHKVKRIEVKPKGGLSYQYHYKRSEVWTMVKGEAIVTLDGKRIQLNAGDVIEIPREAKHRIKKPRR
jgi:mannose-6-phosphate isomerase